MCPTTHNYAFRCVNQLSKKDRQKKQPDGWHPTSNRRKSRTIQEEKPTPRASNVKDTSLATFTNDLAYSHLEGSDCKLRVLARQGNVPTYRRQ